MSSHNLWGWALPGHGSPASHWYIFLFTPLLSLFFNIFFWGFGFINKLDVFMISNSIWNEIGNRPLGSSELSFISSVAERVPNLCGRSTAAGISVCMRETDGKWVLLPVSTSILSQGRDGGRSFGAGVPPRNGEMDCERKECRASFVPWFLNLFIYISPTWPGRPAKFMHVCVLVGLVWSLHALQTSNACSLNFNIYSIALDLGSVVVIAFPMRFTISVVLEVMWNDNLGEGWYWGLLCIDCNLFHNVSWPFIYLLPFFTLRFAPESFPVHM